MKVLFISVFMCLINSSFFFLYICLLFLVEAYQIFINDNPAASRVKVSLFSNKANITFLIFFQYSNYPFVSVTMGRKWFILDFIHVLKILILVLIGIDLLFIPFAFPIDTNCSFIIILVDHPFSFRICPKYFASFVHISSI